MRDIIGAPAGWLARAIRTKKVSSLEVVRAHLEHIHTVNPRLNAVVFATAESALKQARAADRRNTRKNALGPLHGVPFTAKDIFDTAGLPTTAGLRMLRTNIPDHDATVIARMRQAGAILIGKTNCPPGGVGGGVVVVGHLFSVQLLGLSQAGPHGVVAVQRGLLVRVLPVPQHLRAPPRRAKPRRLWLLRKSNDAIALAAFKLADHGVRARAPGIRRP